MKSVITLILFVTSFALTAQTPVPVFIPLDGKMFNCDSAYTNLEMQLCSKCMLDESINQYKITLKAVYTCLDTLIAIDKRNKPKSLKENPNQNFALDADHEKIKNMLMQSTRLFEQWAKIEMNIEGEFYGMGRERVVGENIR